MTDLLVVRPPRDADDQPDAAGLVEYPFQLRRGQFVYLRLPTDLTQADVERLRLFLATLVMAAAEREHAP